MVAPLDAVYYMIMNNHGPDYPRFRDRPIIINPAAAERTKTRDPTSANLRRSLFARARARARSKSPAGCLDDENSIGGTEKRRKERDRWTR